VGNAISPLKIKNKEKVMADKKKLKEKSESFKSKIKES